MAGFAGVVSTCWSASAVMPGLGTPPPAEGCPGGGFPTTGSIVVVVVEVVVVVFFTRCRTWRTRFRFDTYRFRTGAGAT